MKKALLLIILASVFGHPLAAQSGTTADATVVRDTLPPSSPDSSVTVLRPAADTLPVQPDSLKLLRDTLSDAPLKEEKSQTEPPAESERTAQPSPKEDVPPPPPPAPPRPPKTRLATGQFEVLVVKGVITNRRTGRVLQQKSIVRRDDPLQFSSTANRLALVDEHQNTFIARPGSDLRRYDLEPIREKFDKRPGKILNYIAFVKYLEGRDFLVLGGKAGIEVGREKFPMDQDHFFYIQYDWTGDGEPVNKKLSYSGAVLYFDRTEIYRVDNRPVDPSETSNFKLYYYDAVQQKSTLINTFTIVFPDEAEVRAAVQVLIDHFGTIDQEALLNAVENLLFEEYGVPEKQNLADWLYRNFGLVAGP